MSNRSASTVIARAAALGSLAAGVLSGLPGCSSNPYSAGPTQTMEQRHKAYPIDYAAISKVGYRLDWEGFPSITGSLPIQYLHAYPDMVVTLEQGSTLTILEPNTGARHCAVQLANPLTKFTGVVREQNRFFAAAEGEVFTVDAATCNLTGRVANGRTVSTEPLLFGNLLIFGSGAGELLAELAGGTVGGVKVWGFYSTGGGFDHNPVLIGSAVGAVSQAGRVVFLDAASGALLGETTIYGGLATNPVADDHLMFVASTDQSIYAFAPAGARMIWRYRTPTPLHTQPTLYAGRLYCAVPGQGLIAFDAPTGNVLWTSKDFQGTIVAMNQKHLVGFDGEQIVLIDPERGDVLDRAKIPGIAFLSPDKFEDGNLYAVTKAGVVAKLLPR